MYNKENIYKVLNEKYYIYDVISLRKITKIILILN